jgi:hypothetical protein
MGPGTCALGQLYLLSEYVFVSGWLDKVDLHGPGLILMAPYCTCSSDMAPSLCPLAWWHLSLTFMSCPLTDILVIPRPHFLLLCVYLVQQN